MCQCSKVSVIIPTYNRCESLKNAIRSVINQTYQNLEIIVVDDGSTDSTKESLVQFGDRIKVICQENQGPSIARNIGVSHSSGEILTFLDSDDTWHHQKIEKQVHLLSQLGPKIVCCISNSILENSKGATTTSFHLAQLPSNLGAGVLLNPTELLTNRFLLFNQAVAIRKSAFQTLGGFNRDLTILEDHDLALRLSILGPWAILSDLLVFKKESDDGYGKYARNNRINELKVVRKILLNFKISHDHSRNINFCIDHELEHITKLINIESNFDERCVLQNSRYYMSYYIYKIQRKLDRLTRIHLNPKVVSANQWLMKSIQNNETNNY
jgi:glycosyltransferase involved in cell wall biosynthesis